MKRIRIKISGRPGWHIECSVMSQKFLKTGTLDIHAGGRDLIFPHHENEIAQAEALTGKPFAKYWIHHGLLTINGQKMAKSLGNFVTIRDFIAKYQNPDLLKLFFLSAHYSHPIDYSEEKIVEARQAMERIMIFMEKADKIKPKFAALFFKKKFKEIEEFKSKFIASMDDDFNTPEALACVFELVNLGNKNIDKNDFVQSVKYMIKELLGILGISLKKYRENRTPEYLSDNIIRRILMDEAGYTEDNLNAMKDDQIINASISERNKARREKNYALSDKIRKELEEKGIILEDTKEGTTWRRKI